MKRVVSGITVLAAGLALSAGAVGTTGAYFVDAEGGALSFRSAVEPDLDLESVCGALQHYAGVIHDGDALDADPDPESVAAGHPTGPTGYIVVGTDGDDILSAGNHGDCLVGGSGDDTLNGGNGADILAGGNGDDTLLGGTNHDVLLGGDGNDRLDGGQGPDSLYAGDGDDLCVSEGAPDELEACETTELTKDQGPGQGPKDNA